VSYLAHERTVAREHLCAIVATVREDDMTEMQINHWRARVRELERTAALLADARHERVVACRDELHTVVVGVGDDDAITLGIDRNFDRAAEVPGTPALGTECTHERAIVGREHLDAMVEEVSHEQRAACRVEREARGEVELAFSRSADARPDREQESSIALRVHLA